MGKLEDMERRITTLEDKVFPPLRRTRYITAYFKDGPLRGETKQVPDVGEYKVPLMPATAAAFTPEYDELDHFPFMVAIYRPYAPRGVAAYEYRIHGYECSGSH